LKEARPGMKMRPFGRLIRPSTALRRLNGAVHPILSTERAPVAESLGRVAARTYRARFPVPPFARATWDGYAFASSSAASASRSLPARLRVVGEVFAEGAFDRVIRPGEAVAIATGAPLPRGTDTVEIFEDAPVQGALVSIRRAVPKGERVADPGEDFALGSTVVRSGDVLSPASLGGLAATGTVRVELYRRPRVALIPNGNELLEPGSPLSQGRIYEINNLTLSGVVRAAGGMPHPHPPVPDVPARIERAIRRALLGNDLVIVTGGSSVGERDYLPQIFPRLGRLLFHGVAIRPGKPTLAVAVGKKVVLGFPGHPTSCLSNGFWLLLPALRKLARLPGPGWIVGDATMAESYVVRPTAFETVVPLRVDIGLARPTFRDSSAITSLAGTNAFVVLPPQSTGLSFGQKVSARFLLPPLAVPPAVAVER
ncbi:MAG: molybdopterin molybdotransferase MoeA, partial [Thermoplasmata archaeon]|nr:molybdopterin molybdotransferase MoeA [Thermoplasmata archaeon]